MTSVAPLGSSDSPHNVVRAYDILWRLAQEHDGPWWKRIIQRWRYPDEPARNDAANLLRGVRWGQPPHDGCRFVGGRR